MDVFDICGLVYQAGLDGLPTLVYQDRDGELVGSSSREFVRLSYSGFKMLSQVAAVLEGERPPPPATRDEDRSVKAPSSNAGALLVLDFEEEKTAKSDGGGLSFRLDLANMADLLTVFVPLIIAQPNPARQPHLGGRHRDARVLDHVFDRLRLAPRPSVHRVRIAPDQGVRERREEETCRLGRPVPLPVPCGTEPPPHVRPARGARNQGVWDSLPVEERRSKAGESEKKRRELEKRFKSWEIEDKAIIVKKWWYVMWVLLGCGVLVVGGIMVGCFLGQRLTGVDPFNITVFAWVLAGFIILSVAKSLLVSEWPWRDFLKGRVPCRSVSELVEVTGVDAQEILEYLLSRELYTILAVKGPYCRPFLRKSDGHGFSIDEKFELRTLLASGILVVKVTGRQGPGLVCLDLRRGANGKQTICHSDKIEKEEYVLGCFDLHEAFDEGHDVPLLRVRSDWTRILGVYHKPKKLFR